MTTDQGNPGSQAELFFTPGGVAVVGVSDSPDNLARNIVENLIEWGFAGRVVPVGPGGGTVHGLAVVRSVDELPSGVDLACVLTPASTVPDLVAALAGRGVRAVCIQSGGFNESGGAGGSLAEEVAEIARRHGVRLVGPNCLGSIDTGSRVCTPFGATRVIEPGPVGLMSQSGGVMLSLLRDLRAEGLGLSRAVSFGNKLDLDEVDFVECLAADPRTEVLCAYLEDIRRGRALLRAARETGKPIVLLKSNRSKLAEGIASSHTAALVSDHAVLRAASRQAGIVLAESSAEAITAVKAMLLPPVPGPRIAVLSRSGGHAVLAADACADHGFELPPLPASLIGQVRSRVRADVISLGNPMDLGDLWDPATYERLLERTAEVDEIDAILFVFVAFGTVAGDVPLRMAGHARAVSERTGKPIAYAFLGWHETQQACREAVRWPTFSSVEEAVAALAISRDCHARVRSLRGRAAPSLAQDAAGPSTEPGAAREGEPSRLLPLEQTLALVGEAGLPVVPTRVVEDSEAAAQAAAELGFPVAVKLLAEDLIHKSDAGGVALGLETEAAVKAACSRMFEARDQQRAAGRVVGFAVQQMAEPGLEAIVGFRRDPTFGPVVLAGLGGTLVEVLRDVAIRVAPVGREEALEMIDELAGAPLLGGYRGSGPLDREALARVIADLSQLAMVAPGHVCELELNPVIVHSEGHGCVAVDLRALS